MGSNRSLVMFIAAASVAFVLASCSTERQYKDLRSQYRNNTLPDYYQQTVQESTTAPASAEDEFLTDLEKRLLAYRDEWAKKAQGENAASPAILDLDAPSFRKQLTRARSKALDADLNAGLNLNSLLAAVYVRNPKLKAARAKLRAAAERYPQAVQLDNILKQYNAFTKELDTLIGPKQQKEMQSMKFPFADATALKGKIVNEEVAAAQQAYEMTLRDLIAQAENAYFDYSFLLDAIRINKENQGLLEPVLKVARSQYRVGSSKYGEVIMLQVELSKLTDAIITLEQGRDTVRAQINALIDRKTEAKLGAPSPVAAKRLAVGIEGLYAAAVKNRQEIRKLQFDIQRMELMIQLASKMTYPDATLGASYFEDRMKQEAKFMPKRTLEERNVAFFGQKDAYVREMRLQVTAMGKKLADLQNKTRFLVKKAHFQMDASRRSLELYRSTLLPQAVQAFKAAETGYKNGKTGFITYLDAQRTLLKFKLEEKRALRNYHKSLVELDRLAGRKLTRKDQN